MRSGAATRTTRIVGIGGGTGLSVLLAGLRAHTHTAAAGGTKTLEITGVVSVADDGGSSGELRERFEALPSVHHVEEMGSRIPRAPSEETKLLVQAFRAQLARLPERPTQTPAPTPSAAGYEIEQLYVLLKSLPNSSASEARIALKRAGAE